jgi:hypothetical protein
MGRRFVGGKQGLDAKLLQRRVVRRATWSLTFKQLFDTDV